MASRGLSLTWPLGGFDESMSFSRQPKGTTPSTKNVRPYDPVSGRARGGQRPGLSRHINATVSGANPIQCLHKFMLAADYSAANTIATRVMKFLAISNGTIKVGTSSYATVTNGTSAFDATTPAIYAAAFADDTYFVDETNRKFFDSSTNTISAWGNATAGTFPTGNSKYSRLIASYNERLIVAGLGTDPQNFFATAVGDPEDWDYAPAAMPSTRAFAGNSGSLTRCSDKIMCLAPVPNADYMFFGCDHSIYQMSGDLAAGGRLDRLGGNIGMAWGRPYVFNRQGLMYFWGSRGGIFTLGINGLPRPISEEKIPEELKEVDTSSSLITMAWDDRYQGIWIFVTPLGGGATTNYYYCEKTESFWADSFATAAFNPVSVELFDGDDPNDRAILIGCQDGIVRKIDRDVYSDDDVAIDSHVFLGHLYFKGSSTVQLDELQATLSDASSNVECDIYPGDSPEAAFANSEPAWRGTFYPGRNQSYHPGTMAESLFIKLGNNTLGETWSLEKLDVAISGSGRAIQRLTA